MTIILALGFFALAILFLCFAAFVVLGLCCWVFLLPARGGFS